jgi:hypothetical protein
MVIASISDTGTPSCSSFSRIDAPQDDNRNMPIPIAIEQTIVRPQAEKLDGQAKR